MTWKPSKNYQSILEAAQKRVENLRAERKGALSRAATRDPCVRCGTRYDRHDEFGCKRWRGAP